MSSASGAVHRVTLVRSAEALRRLYERYLSSTALKTSARRPGEWLSIAPDSEDARTFEAAFGLSPNSERAEDIVRDLDAINGSLGVREARDVRIVAQRVGARSKKLELRFLLVPRGKSTRGAKPTPRVDLPRLSAQLDLHSETREKVYVDLLAGDRDWDDASKGRRTEPATTAPPLPPSDATESGTTAPAGDLDGVEMVLPDGSPIPDLSGLLTEIELGELWRAGKLNDANTLDVLFEDYQHLIDAMLEDDEVLDFASMADRFRAKAILASGTPKVGASEEAVEGDWGSISNDVSEWTQRSVRLLREADATGHLFVLAPSPGTGKCLGRGTLVLRYDGRVIPVEEVRVGDLLMGPDSTPRRVLSTTSGTGALRRIVPRKGNPWICNDAHILTVVHSVTGIVTDIDIETFERLPAYRREKLKLFQPESVTFPRFDSETAISVSPYFIGVWLGDGGKTLTRLADGTTPIIGVTVSKPDPEIEAACRAEAHRFNGRVRSHNADTTSVMHGLRGLGWRNNSLLVEMRRLFSDEIRVPKMYLLGSSEVRMQVLAGLLDTDGHLTCGTYEIAQKSDAIAEDISFLARSLGFRVTCTDKWVNGTRYNRLFVSGDCSRIPLRIPRKIASPRRQKKNVLRSGFVVEDAGVGEFFGFSLDGDSRFLLGDFTVTHNSHSMMVAAEQEQNARRRVGYAVLSRAQIPEASERLRSMGQNVRLIVIEGRHEKNCWNFDQVTVATDAGFSPGRTVCPNCEFYPQFGRGQTSYKRKDICPYFATRKEAVIDRALADPKKGYMARPPAIILTTHAAAIQGSHIASRKNYTFWHFDTLFIDEDPTSAMVTQSEISEASMTYSQTDDRGHIDGPTRGTMLIRDAMKEALRLRAVAEERGFVDSTGAEDRVHTRYHGSSFAGTALHALFESVALSTQGLNLRAVGSLTIDGMTEGPPKGEIMSLTADEVAARYPNRHLLPIFSTLEEETVAVAEARAAGTTLEPAYRVHLDLVPEEDGHRAVLRVHQLLGYANLRTNIIVGDAYADTVHYEGLFDRYRSNGRVQVIKHRATWPATSTLVRIVTRAGSKHISNTTQLLDHLEVKVRPVLELERGRRIIFYIHKAMKEDFSAWIESVREELDVYEYAIEHWGSGRGKDTYKDFDTFIAVTEYVPNIGALVHEANTVAALAAPGNTRVGHWNSYAPRSGSSAFANSLATASPFFQAAFHRKATDELAQAVHRIRPAIPSRDGRQKRAYVFGHQVPWTDELVAATAATAVVDNGKEDIDLETEALGRGARFSMTETLGLVSEREVAGAIWTVFKTLGCWSHMFSHAMISVPSWASVEEATVGPLPTSDVKPPEHGIAYKTLSISDPTPCSPPIVDRVLVPPNAWSYISDRVRENSRVYRAGLMRFLADVVVPPARVHRATWMPSGSKGHEFWGDRDRFNQVLSAYSPAAKKVPF